MSYIKPGRKPQILSESRQAFEDYLRSEGYSERTITTTGSALTRLERLAQANDKMQPKDITYAQRIVRWIADVSPQSTLARWLKQELEGKIPEPKREPHAVRPRGKIEAISSENWFRLRELVLADSSVESLVIKVLMGSSLRCHVAIEQPIGMLQHALVAADDRFIRHVKNLLDALPQKDTLRMHMTPLPFSRSPYIRVYNLLQEYAERLGVEGLSMNQIMKTPAGVRRGRG